MPLHVTVKTQTGSLEDRWTITNRGHPDTGDHPPEDDLRRYEIVGPQGKWHVNHNRGDGARVLALYALLGPGVTGDE